MTQKISLAIVTVATLVSAGCATKSYVQKSVDPVSAKVNEVASKTDQQGQTLDQTRQTLDKTNQNLDQTRQSLDKDETQLSATDERARSADSRAGQAIDSANQANQKADKLSDDLGDLRNVVSNLDEYKQVAGTTVNFKFNSDRLTPEAKQALDQMVANQNQFKRFFIAVEGFTDKLGSTEYNEALSRRRADAVVEYLVGEHSIPIYRIHMVGLGKMKPVEDAETRAANAKNRRVEVTLFSADQNVAGTR